MEIENYVEDSTHDKHHNPLESTSTSSEPLESNQRVIMVDAIVPEESSSKLEVSANTILSDTQDLSMTKLNIDNESRYNVIQKKDFKPIDNIDNRQTIGKIVLSQSPEDHFFESHNVKRPLNEEIGKALVNKDIQVLISMYINSIGNLQLEAEAALSFLVHSNRDYTTSLIAAGCIQVLLRQLQTENEYEMELTLLLLRYLSRDEKGPERMARTDGLQKLLDTLPQTVGKTRQRALAVISRLTLHSEDACIKIGSGSTLLLLLETIQMSSSDNTTKEHIAHLLACASANDVVKSYIAGSGGIPIIVPLLGSTCIETCTSALYIIHGMSKKEGYHQPIIEAGALSQLVLLLQKFTVLSEDVTSKTASTLANLSDTTNISQELFGMDSFKSSLVRLMEKGSVGAKTSAVTIISNIISKEERNKDFVIAGVLNPMIKLVAMLDLTMKEYTVKTILKLIRNNDDKTLDISPLRLGGLKAHIHTCNGVDKNIIKIIVSWLSLDSVLIRTSAAKILSKIFKEEVRDDHDITDLLSTCLSRLLSMLGSTDEFEQESAIIALSGISRHHSHAIILFNINTMNEIIKSNMLQNKSKDIIYSVVRTIFNISEIFKSHETRIIQQLSLELKKQFIIDITRCIADLILILTTGTNSAIEYCLNILLIISESADGCFAIVDHGGLKICTSLLSVGTKSMLPSCVGILRNLSDIHAYRSMISCSEIVSPLVKLLSIETTNYSIQCNSCIILHRISSSEEIKKEMNSNDVLSYLMPLIECTDEEVKTPALVLLGSILETDITARDHLVHARRHIDILKLLSEKRELVEAACCIVCYLSLNKNLIKTLVKANIITSLVLLLNTNEEKEENFITKQKAVETLINIALTDEKYSLMILNAKVISPVVKLLLPSPPLLKEKLAVLLRCLSVHSNALEEMIQEDAIVSLVILLKKGCINTIEEAIIILNKLVVIEKNRLRIKDSGILFVIFGLITGKYTDIIIENSLGVLRYLSTDFTTVTIEDDDIKDDNDESGRVSVATTTCDNIVARMGIAKLSELLTTGTEITKIHIAAIICNILSDDAYYLQISDNILKTIVGTLSKPSDSSKESVPGEALVPTTEQEFILEAIWTMVCNKFDVNILIQAGLLDALFYCLQNGTILSKVKSALIVSALAVVADVVFSSNMIKILLSCLRVPSYEVSEVTMSAIRAVSLVNSNSSVFLNLDTINAVKQSIVTGTGSLVNDGTGVLINITSNVTDKKSNIHFNNIMQSDVLTCLVRAIYNPDGAKECITEALWLTAKDEKNRSKLMSAGAAPALLSCLSSEDEEVVKNAINSLCRIILSPSSFAASSTSPQKGKKKEVSTRSTSVSGIKEVLVLLKTSKGKSTINALALLYKICIQDSVVADVLMNYEEDLVTPLLPLLEHGTPAAKLYMAGILSKVAAHSRKGRDTIMKDPFGYEFIVEAMTDGTLRNKEHAVSLFSQLAMDEANRSRMCASGLIAVLVELLHPRHGPTIQSDAASTIYSLARKGPKDKIGEAGAIPPLVKLFRDGKGEGKNNALLALQKLAKHSTNRDELKALGITKEGIEYTGMFW